MPWAPLLFTSWLVTHAAGLPPQPEYQKIGTSLIPAAAALASSWSSSVNENVPCAGSMVFHGMSISAVVRPSALSAAKLASDQGVPLSSKSSWVDHSGVAVDAAAIAAGCTAVVFASAREAAVETAIRLPATVSAAAAQEMARVRLRRATRVRLRMDSASFRSGGSPPGGHRFFRNETDRGSVESSTGAPVRSRSWLGLGLSNFAEPFAQL